MSESKELHVRVRETYGVERIYPVNTTAELFTSLIGQKTLSHESIRTIKQLGFAVVVVPHTVKEI